MALYVAAILILQRNARNLEAALDPPVFLIEVVILILLQAFIVTKILLQVLTLFAADLIPSNLATSP